MFLQILIEFMNFTVDPLFYSETCVHRFITKNTVEETIYKMMSTDGAGLLTSEKCTIKTLVDLFADTEFA